MKVCESWLREWVNPPLSSQEISQQLTMAGLEVDACYPVAGVFDNVVVAQVLNTRPHPEADRLTLCEVDMGGAKPLQIVCGAANVRKGLRVALAMIGAHLPGDLTIKETKLRGELSQGMLCSASELGIEERSEGIMELPDNAPLGVDLREYLLLNDQVFDIDLTPNRADCLSVLGVAREVAALNRIPLTTLPTHEHTPSITDKLSVTLHAPEGCAQYVGRVIRGIDTNAQTPPWMKEKLRRSGLRSLHPVVDVTNYVMIELGQPLHAFDLQTIQTEIHVRYALDGEPLTLLNGQAVKLHSNVLVIADDQKVLAMAGIMGGADSAVSSSTTDIFLESAYFNPITIAGVARKFGLSSDSSQRFERGVDPALQCIALERATYLLQSIVGGSIGPIEWVKEPQQLPEVSPISFNPSQVLRFSGLDIPVDEMEDMLTRLGMRVVREASHWQVTAPSFRVDLFRSVDLVEEIIRLHGYQNIPSIVTEAPMKAGNMNPNELLLQKMGSFFANRGYRETISYGFVDPGIQRALYPEKQGISLLNPISPELAEMRLGLWPGLLASMIHNMHRQQSALKLFESGVVFHLQQGEVQELPFVAGLVTGSYGDLNWCEVSGAYDFYDVKGDLQALLVLLNLRDVRFQRVTHSALHPGKSAKLLCGSDELGWIGALHPQLMDSLDITDEVILFELSLTGLLKSKPTSYRTISKYPQTRRDLSLIIDDSVSAEAIEQAVREVVQPGFLKAFDVFDVYTGESIPRGKKSLAIALTLQDDNRTLIDADINAMIDNVLKKLETTYSAILRQD